MKLSFIIPAYNEENYIAQCIESVLKQTKDKQYDTEIIVVNNASTDKTKEIAKLFSGVTVIDEPKKGLPQARQSGFLASTGDLIANIDSDAVLPDGWTDKALKEFSEEENLVALSGPFVFYDVSRATNFFVRFFFSLGSASNSLSQRFFKKGSVLQGGNYILKRSALEKIGGYNVGVNFCIEDIDVARRISSEGKVKFTMSFPIYTSGRRLKAEGTFTTGFYAAMNYIWLLFTGNAFKKSISKHYN